MPPYAMDWDMTSYFDAFDSPAYREFKSHVINDLNALLETAEALPFGEESNPAAWRDVLLKLEDAMSRFAHLRSYLACLCAASSQDEAYLAEEASMGAPMATYSKIDAVLKTGIGQMPAYAFEALVADEALAGAELVLRTLREEASCLMSPVEERLAAELSVDGSRAWSRLYSRLAGSIEFDLKKPDGSVERVPMAQRMAYLGNGDPAIREAAFTGGNAAWEAHGIATAAALNGLAGTRLTLDRQRGRENFLQKAHVQQRCSEETLEAMFAAIDERVALPREILTWRASRMGLPGVSYADLHAPLAPPEGEPTTFSWESGVDLIEQSFRARYADLADFFREMVDKRWIDHTPRKAKRPGGFCTSSRVTEESRIFMTFEGTLGAVMTLAHEAGHAWHNRKLKGVRMLAHMYPMTLAECASTFAEMVLARGVMADDSFSASEKASLLDAQVRHATAFLLDLPVRYRFEKRFYEERRNGELPVSRLKELMAETQREHFGILMEGGEDPWFWASKQHFYIHDVFFYNFPYTFGFLLSLSLWARFEAEGPGFLGEYEHFLRLSGQLDCETLLRETLGEDITQPAFWTRAIDCLQQPFAELKALHGEG